MKTVESYREFTGAVDDALLDADLFLKYRAPEKAVGRLQRAVMENPRAIALHEKLRELLAWQKRPMEAARHCLALATLYIERERYDDARERLLEAKQLDHRISIAPGLEAIRRARLPAVAAAPITPAAAQAVANGLLNGHLDPISLFDVIQLLENSRLTGALELYSDATPQRVLFNEGSIAGSEAEGVKGMDAFRQVLQVRRGTFAFVPATKPFPVTISALNNTSLLLDTLRTLDEENADTADTGDWA